MTVPRILSASLAVLVLACPVAGASPKVEEEVEIKGVVGESPHSIEEARQIALSKAIAQAGGEIVRRETTVHNFELMRDTIYSRSVGYVRRYVVRRKEEVDGVYRVVIDAVVAKGKLAEDWGALNIMIQRVGWPNLLIVVEEKATGVGSSGNVAEYKIRDLFDKVGLDIIDDETISMIPGLKKIAVKDLKDDKAILMAAARAHADYAIIARAHARAGQPRGIHGINLVPVTADIDVKVVGAENPFQIASKSASARRLSRDSGTAAREALQAAAEEVAEQILMRMLEHWSRDLDVGARFVLVGERVDTEVLNALVERLRRLEGVKSANVVHHREDEMTIVKVITRLKADSLVREIPELSGRRLRVTGYTGRRVDFGMKKPSAGKGPATKAAAP